MGKIVWVAAAIFSFGASAIAQPVAAPSPAAPPAARPAALPPARTPTAALAREMAEAAVDFCSAYPMGAAVLDASGAPKLVYVPDRSAASIAEFAIRKARTALRYKVVTSEIAARAAADPAFAAQLQADPTLSIRPGGAPLFVGGELIGALGMGGAPSENDEACALKAVQQVQSRLR